MPGLLTLFTSNRTKREIAEAQRELHLRKKLVHARHRILKTHVKQALASKKALAAAGVTGFMIGQVSQSSKYCKKCGDETEKSDFSDLIRTGLRIYSLTQTATTLTGFMSAD
ncbi:MAG: hypothetical protein JJU03_13560 [Idiomarina sp.]|nr:hypothetical protein [Idiomarina sp.]